VLQGGADLPGYGNALANTLSGNSGNNLLDATSERTLCRAGRATTSILPTTSRRRARECQRGRRFNLYDRGLLYTLGQVENLILQGGADLHGYGNGGANVLYGNSGNNLLDGVRAAPT
jgi:Ca2+-binding RTX toxin-like protein